MYIMYIHNKTYSRKMALHISNTELMLFIIVVNSTPMHYELKRGKNCILVVGL